MVWPHLLGIYVYNVELMFINTLNAFKCPLQTLASLSFWALRRSLLSLKRLFSIDLRLLIEWTNEVFTRFGTPEGSGESSQWLA